MSKKQNNFTSDYIDPAILEFKNFISNKDAQLVWSARTAARRKALEQDDSKLSESIAGVSHVAQSPLTWAISTITDPQEIQKAREEWNKKAVHTAWLIKKAKERMILEKRLKIVGAIALVIMIVVVPIMFKGAMESAKVKKCKRNMRNILFSLEDYVIENERLPELPEELAYVVSYDTLGDYGARKRSYKCPSDKAHPSYAVNPDIVGRAWDELSDDTVILVDSNAYIFEDMSSLDYRHRYSIMSTPLALAVYKDGTFGEYAKPKGKKITKQKEDKASKPKAMSSKRYNECQRQQQLCERNCNSYALGSDLRMSCTNDCWARFDQCTKGE